MFQSLDGYLWLATEGGVVRFDGSSFSVLNHKTDPAFTSDDISAIAQDTSGTLWFGTADGLLQGRGPAYRRFSERDGLPSAAILSLAAAGDGSLLVLTSRGLARFDGKSFAALDLAAGTVLSLQSTADGAIWVFATDGVFRYQLGTIKREASSVAPSAIPDSSLGLQSGPAGRLWTRSARSVVLTTPTSARTVHIGRDLPGSRVAALHVDRQGTGWIGTNRGLFFLTTDVNSQVQAVDALRLQSVLSIMEDREENLWIGTETGGLHVLRPRKFRSELSTAGEAVTAGALSSHGTIWFGTREDGVRKLENGVAEQPIAGTSLTSPVVLSMAPGHDGDLWVGTPDGLNRVAGKKVEQYTSSNGLPDDFVRSVLVDARGTVWAGTRRGLARIEGSRITTLTRENGLGSDSIGPLLDITSQRSGGEKLPVTSPELWIGTSGGLSHLRGTRLENFAPYQDGSKNVVTAIAQENNGALWVGLHGAGLVRFENGRFAPVVSSSLPGEIIALVTDSQGYLWLRGMRGVYRVALAAIRTCADDASRCNLPVAVYGVPEGMPSDAAAAEGTSSIWLGSNGELWFATSKGIAVADPAHLPINSTPPPVVVQRFLVDETDIPLNPGDTKIGPGHIRYSFDYAALSYTSPSRVRYRYRLDGFDRDWLDAGSVHTASYTSLPPRRYRFRVQAQNNDGVWNETGAELRFHVQPPVYRTWWFYALALFTVAGLAAVIFRLRLRIVQRRFALVLDERNRMAREIHDTLAQDFVSVSLQLDLTAQMLKTQNVEQATSQLQATRKLVKDGLEAARQSIWNLRANMAQDSLPTRLTALVNRYPIAEHSPRLRIGGAFHQIDATAEEEVLRVAQESLANIHRHAAATDVLVELHYSPDALRLTIRDNGRGFSMHEAGRMEGHYGIRGMQERAASLQARLTIESSPEEGTTVTLLLPLRGREERSS